MALDLSNLGKPNVVIFCTVFKGNSIHLYVDKKLIIIK